MPHRDIREYDAKTLLARHLGQYLKTLPPPDTRVVQVTHETDLKNLVEAHPWLLKTKLTVKPDMLFGKRGKLGLVELDVDWEKAKQWISQHKKPTNIGGVSGTLTHFLIEPYIQHKTEYYLSISTEREYDKILFSTQGGVDIEDGWEHKVQELHIPMGEALDEQRLQQTLLEGVAKEERALVAAYMASIYTFFQEMGFTNFETNPFCMVDGHICFLDVVASIDDASPSSVQRHWTWEEFPNAFGSQRTPEEEYIRSLDGKTGASLKFTLLNPEGRMWLLVSGGGASVIYADTVSDLGYAKELANYGEYSGNPSTDETWDYTRTVLDLMTREKHSKGKILIIGGGIANFTDTAKTFDGIIKAMRQYQDKLRQGNVKIFVRRGGPNYERALKLIKNCGDELGIPIEAYGPEMHMTEVVRRGIEALA